MAKGKALGMLRDKRLCIVLICTANARAASNGEMI